jgi:pre-mRNA-splicing factor SYF1
MCIRFAELERKLGEIDRARAVYAHASQMCDPRVSACVCDRTCEFLYITVARWLLGEMERIRSCTR